MFKGDEGFMRRTFAIGRTRMHRHPGIVEIVLVLRGSLHITVSSERFSLAVGDYAVLNAGDPHMLVGSDDNVTALLHVRLADFAEIVPGLDGVIFACESFDLPRSRGQEDELRQLLLGVLQASEGSCRARLSELLTTLCDGYAYEDYYERRQLLSLARRIQFREIVSAMRTRLAERDVLERVAEAHHYHKNSLSRIVRDATAVSFSDLLNYLRVSAAEIALLESDATVSQIAASCGFSDAKYLTRTFRAWFGERPADYRRRIRPLLHGDEVLVETPTDGEQLLEALRRSPAAPVAKPRLSPTPLLTKTMARRPEQFVAGDLVSANAAQDSRGAPATIRTPRVHHIYPIKVPVDEPSSFAWREELFRVDLIHHRPVLVFPIGKPEALARVVAEVRTLDVPTPDYWIAYGSGSAESAQALADELFTLNGVKAVPIAAEWL